MGIGRRILLTLLTPLLSGLLFALALDVGAVRIIGAPSNIKHQLSSSGIYSTVVPQILKQTGTISTSYGDISTSDPQVQQAVKAAVSPSDIQGNVEGAINNVYAWLNGQISQPNFSISLANSQTKFNQSLATSIGNNLSGLPTCTSYSEIASYNPLSASCLPPGISADSASQTVQTALSSSGNFLSQANIKAANIKDSQGQSIFSDKLKNAPRAFRLFKRTLFILGVLTIGVAAGIIFLWPSRRSGLKHVGVVILLAGAVILALSLIFKAVINSIVKKADFGSSSVAPSLRYIFTHLAQQIDQSYLIFGIVYAVVGLALIFGPRFISPRPKLAPVQGSEAASG